MEPLPKEGAPHGAGPELGSSADNLPEDPVGRQALNWEDLDGTPCKLCGVVHYHPKRDLCDSCQAWHQERGER